MENKLIYLASPYSANPQKNYESVLEFVVDYKTRTNEIIFSPIIYGHPIAKYENKNELSFDSWQNFDLTMLSKSDELWVLKLDGWERSEGIKQEIEFVEKRNKVKHQIFNNKTGEWQIKRKYKRIKVRYIEC